jgi:dual specificity phosphatase 3
MADFNFVTQRLATGAAINDDADARALVNAGITHVVDCRAEFNDATLLLPYGIEYLYNGTDDDGQPKTAAWFQTSILFVQRALGHHWAAHDKHHMTRVYVHCAAGLNRGPSTLYAVLRAWGLTATQTTDLIRAARPQATLRYVPDAERALTELGWT